MTISSMPVPQKSRFLDKLMFVVPFFMLGRVQEVFPVLWPFRLVLLTAVLLIIMTVLNKGLARPRLALFWRSRTFRWFAVMVALMLLSVFTSIYKSHSLSAAKEFVLYFGVILLALNCQVDRKEDFKFGLIGIVLTMFIMGIICYVSPRYVEGSRVAANWSYDPNDTALFFVMLLALILPSAKYVRRLYRWFLYVLAVMGVGVVILTQSRGGLVAGVVTITAWGLSRGVKGVVRLFLLGTLGVTLILAVVPAEQLQRFTSIGDLESDYNMTAKGGRMDIWKNGLSVFMENPIFGTGFDTFKIAEGLANAGGKWSQAHNSFLEVAVELGLPGIIVFLGMLLSAYKMAKPTDEADWFGRGLRLSLISYLAGGIFLSWGYHIVPYFVLSLAMIRERVLAMEGASVLNLSKEESSEQRGAALSRRKRYSMRAS